MRLPALPTALLRTFRRPFLLRLLLALGACGLLACGSEAPALNVGQAAPAFHSEPLAGQPADFPAAYAGRPVVLRFWADWCRYCEGEMQAIERVYQRHRGAGLEVLAVNAGQDRDTAAAFIARIGVSYPALLDPDSAIAKRYGVVGLPTTYFIDRSGVVRGKVVGEASEAVFEQQVEALLQ
jgi:cytochrome c biogenesis protein CcmG, thiol:disulfide interchange protein DsbE